jgi:hypothetical protein
LAKVGFRASRASKKTLSAFERVERYQDLNLFSDSPAGSTDGVEFEKSVARQLNDLGWQTRLTAASGDFGADIIATNGSETLVVQCKDWRGPAGISSVQEVSYARTHYRANLAAVIVSQGFTKAAHRGAENANVLLLNCNSLRGGPLDRRQQQTTVRAYSVGLSFPKASQETKQRAANLNEEYYKSNLEKSKAWRNYDKSSTAGGIRPDFPRRSSFRLCIECQSVLTLDWGKQVEIVCDVCKHFNKFQT